MAKWSRIIIVLILPVIFTGCDRFNWWETMFGGKEEVLIIRGEKEVKGGTIKLEPGSLVEFKTITRPGIAGGSESHGELTLTKGARIIARGTRSKPIVFTAEDSGTIILKEDASNESIFEYCLFDDDVSIVCENSITIQYCKFDHSWIELGKNSQSLIQYNNFSSIPPHGLANEAIRHSNMGALIQYNNIIGYWMGIAASGANISYNNITNSESYAIGAGNADNNYIADCNGKQGVDTTGEQVYSGITYINPQTTPIADAGCGW